MAYEFTEQYKRNDNDFYIEPEWCILSLIKSVDFQGSIHDPACGTGKIPKTFIKEGFIATGCDLVDRGYGSVKNYFEDLTLRNNIVTNPPFNLTEQFIDHALHTTFNKVAILARIAFLNGQRRFRLYSTRPPSHVVILSRRPSMPPGGQLIIPQGGKTDFCWIVWDIRGTDNTKLLWSL